MRVPIIAAVGLVAPTTALAFCGLSLGSTAAPMKNDASEAVLVRLGDQTTLALSNHYSGEPDHFALVVPVPEVLDSASVRVVTNDLITRAHDYSAPRQVAYECDTDTDTDSDTDVDVDTDTDVESDTGGAEPPRGGTPVEGGFFRTESCGGCDVGASPAGAWALLALAAFARRRREDR